MTGIELIAQERARQVEQEGFTAEHDAKFIRQQLAWAAAHWAMPNGFSISADGITVDIGIEALARHAIGIKFNQWQGDRIRQLTYSGALIAAEIDRIQREGENT